MVVLRNIVRYLAIVLAAALVAAGCTSDSEGAEAEPVTTNTSSPAVSDPLATTESTITTSEAPRELVFTIEDPDPTPLEVWDEIRIGELSNGLTYYLMSNDSPGGSISMRLAVNAGGVNEDPLGTGAAHFLEHMMFNGTEKFPGNTVDDALRRIGAEIGPDFNAYTNDTETVYQMTVEDRGDNVEVAFDVLAEWASAATIDPDEVVAEAPVVREEVRLRDESGDGLVNVFFEDAYHLATPFEGVNVSGTAATVNALDAADLRAFYDTWYRPENMAVIVVGDRSLDDMESELRDRFSHIAGRGDASPYPQTALDELREKPFVEVLIEPSVADSYVSVDIPIQTWDTSTVGGFEYDTTELIIATMLNNRLNEGVQTGRLDLIRAGATKFSWNDELSYLSFNFDAEDLVQGTEVFMSELQGNIQNPFTERELDAVLDAFGVSLEQALAGFGTTQDAQFADQFVAHYLSGTDLRSIDDTVDAYFALFDSLTLGDINNHYGWLVTSAEPIVIVVAPDEVRGGTSEEHREAVEQASQAIVDAFDDDTVEIDVLIEEPDVSDDGTRRALKKYRGFELEFDNEIRVLYINSDISEQQVNLLSQSPGGRAMLSSEDGPVAPTAVSAIANSGLGEWDPTQIRRYLAQRTASLSPYLADFSEGFSGSAGVNDLETLFQLLHLSMGEARIDDVPFRQRVEATRDRIDRIGLDSRSAVSVAVSDARTGGGALAAAPTRAEIDALTTERALEIWNDRFASLDDHVVIIVGDVSEGVVIDLARTWLGSLPAATTSDSPKRPPLPGEVNERLSVGSGSSGGSYRLLIVGEADETIENQVLSDVTATILNDRIFTVLRERLGATYGGSARIEFSDPGDQAELLISIDGDPERIDEIAETVEAELDALRAGALTADDFNESISILTSEYNFIGNGFFIEALLDEAYEPFERIIDRQTQLDVLNALRASDVTAFLVNIASTEHRIDIRNVPAS
ncbi:MAG: zinc protease [Verrucomicrobiales bacterium]|jgi:zinc protease